jgi:hypothetical protein
MTHEKLRTLDGCVPVDFDSQFFRAVSHNLGGVFGMDKSVGFTDIDAMTEKLGFPLLIEVKHPNVELTQGALTAQRYAMQNITRRYIGAVGYIVFADLFLADVAKWRRCMGGVWGPWRKGGESLSTSICDWGAWVREQRAMEAWDAKW